MTLQQMENIAIQHGGQCLSKKYRNAHQKLKWECRLGHEWLATYANVSRGSWCPFCAVSYSEEISRFILESLFEKKFKKNRTALCGLELDGYNSNLNIAFEYQGRQHYEFIPYWHKTRSNFDRQKRRDIAKQELCRIKNISCIIIPYTTNNLEYFIVNELDKIGHQLSPKIDYSKFKPLKAQIMDRLLVIAKQKNGKCLSKTYLGIHSKITWQCEKGHEWSATSASILHSNTWCPRCAGVAPLSLSDMQEIAKRRGGKCLSKKYSNNRTKLKWKCAEGHEWESVPLSVRRGHWCPVCGKHKSWKTRNV